MTMMSEDLKRTLTRSAASVLLLESEVIALLCYSGESPGIIPFPVHLLVLMGWLVFSLIYTGFRSGGRRVTAACWIGLCWALPFTLLYSETAIRIDPIPDWREYTYANLVLPALSLLPTLLFIVTEKPAESGTRGRIWQHLLGVLFLLGCVAGMYHYRCQIPYIAEEEVQRALSLSVTGFSASDTTYTVELQIANHTAETITLGHHKKSVKFNHYIRRALIDGLWHGKNNLICTRNVNFTIHELPPHGAITISHTYTRPTEKHPRPDSVSYCFSFVRMNGTEYIGDYTLHASIYRTE